MRSFLILAICPLALLLASSVVDAKLTKSHGRIKASHIHRGIVNQVYNVRSYGAVGDGKTDDTQAILQAATALNSTGGTLYFPTGQYVLNDNIYLFVPASFCGSAVNFAITGTDSSDSVLLWTNPVISSSDPISPAIEVTSDGSCAGLQVTVRGLTIQWNGNSGASSGVLSLYNFPSANLEDVLIQLMPGTTPPNQYTADSPYYGFWFSTINALSFNNCSLSGVYGSLVYIDETPAAQIQAIYFNPLALGPQWYSGYGFTIVGRVKSPVNIDIRSVSFTGIGLLRTTTFGVLEQPAAATITVTGSTVSGPQNNMIELNDASIVSVISSELTGNPSAPYSGNTTALTSCQDTLRFCSPSVTFTNVQFGGFLNTFTPLSGTILVTKSYFFNNANDFLVNPPSSAGSINLSVTQSKFSGDASLGSIQADTFNFQNNVCQNVPEAGYATCTKQCNENNNTGCPTFST